MSDCSKHIPVLLHETIKYLNLCDTGVYVDATLGMGGYTSEHGLAMLQKGETIIPKTQNMLDGSQGITLNIHGDVYDGDNFAQKVSEVLPLALRNTNDIGGI